ncbi:hypothetical protein HOH45_09490 [bacterium]|jgi:hypothetical protein|nr:hypothetical protein [bacterium]
MNIFKAKNKKKSIPNNFSTFHYDLLKNIPIKSKYQLFLDSIGKKNRILLFTHKLTSWPFWIKSQLNPSSAYYQSQSNPTLLNNDCFRNWTKLKTNTLEKAILIDPKGLISFGPFLWSIDFQILDNKKKAFRSSECESISQKLNTETGCLETHYDVEFFTAICSVCPSTSTSDILLKVSILQKSTHQRIDSNSKNELIINIKPFSPEGAGSIDTIQYLSSHALVINKNHIIQPKTPPKNVVCGNYETCQEFEISKTIEMLLSAHCSLKMSGAFLSYPLHDTKKNDFHFSITPADKKKLSNDQKLETIVPDFEETLEKNKEYYSLIQQKYTSFQLPDIAMTSLLKKSLFHLSNLASLKEFEMIQSIPTSKGIEIPQLINALNNSGQKDLSKKLVFDFVTSVSTTEKQTEFNPIMIKTILDTYYVSNDKSLLTDTYTYVKKQVEKIETHSTSYTTILDPSFEKSLWSLSGLESSIKIASILEKPSQKSYFQGITTKLASHIFDQLKNFSIQKSHVVTPVLLNLLDLVYPLNLVNANDSIIDTLLTHLKKNLFYKDKVFNTSFPNGFPILQNFQLAQLLLERKQNTCFSILQWIQGKTLETGSWPDTVHPISEGGSAGSGHSLTASAEYVSFIRNCILNDKTKKLILFPFLSEKILPKFGSPLILKNAPTKFGPVSILLEKVGDQYKLEIESNFHKPPISVTICFPKKIKTILYKGKETLNNSSYFDIPHNQTFTSLFFTPDQQDELNEPDK